MPRPIWNPMLASQKFKLWLKSKLYLRATDDIILLYLAEMVKTNDQDRLRAHLSMFKASYPHIVPGPAPSFSTYMERQEATEKRIKPLQSLTLKQSQRFIREAPDEQYLLHKVIAILGNAGKVTRTQMVSLKASSVIERKDFIAVYITGTFRQIRIGQKNMAGKCADVFRKYMAVRPNSATEPWFLLNYRNGDFTHGPVTVDTVGSTPVQIAKFLKLPNPKMYTFHVFHAEKPKVLSINTPTAETRVAGCLNAPIWTPKIEKRKYEPYY